MCICPSCQSYIESGLPKSKVWPEGYVLDSKDTGPYVVETVVIPVCVYGGSKDTIMKAALNHFGHYIGDIEIADYLCVELGIVPELAHPDNSTCSIGYSPKTGLWYGWSHRAITGFSPGSIVKKGDCAYKPRTFEDLKEDVLTWYEEDRYENLVLTPSRNKKKPGLHAKYDIRCQDGSIVKGSWFHPFEPGPGEWVAQTVADTKQMAIDFAKSVSSSIPSTDINASESSTVKGIKPNKKVIKYIEPVDPNKVARYVWFKYTAIPRTRLLRHHKTKTAVISQDTVYGLRRKQDTFYLVLYDNIKVEFKLDLATATKIVRRSKGYKGKFDFATCIPGTKDILTTQINTTSKPLPKEKSKKSKKHKQGILIPHIIRTYTPTDQLINICVYKSDQSDQPNTIVSGSPSLLKKVANTNALPMTTAYLITVDESNSIIRAFRQGKTRISDLKLQKLIEAGKTKSFVVGA
jgi:hypothetical protein